MIENGYGAGRDLMIAALLALCVPMGIAAQSNPGGSEHPTPTLKAPRTPADGRDALDADAPLLPIVVDGVLDDLLGLIERRVPSEANAKGHV